MLKMRDLEEVSTLFDLLVHPEVFPYVRQKAATSDEFHFITKQTIEAEANGEMISRTIVDEYYNPIGTINLFDIEQCHGFLATWIGQPYFGKGYNQQAKEQFFDELFYTLGIEGIFMKVRRTNTRSLKAVLKLPYVSSGNIDFPVIYQKINQEENVYDLFIITKDQFTAYRQFTSNDPFSTDIEVS
jgi:RimJ/RimL family protein N-acetyltransferase